MKNAKQVILDVAKDFEAMTGRSYGLFEEYKLEDAEVAIVCMNSTAGTTKFVVDNLREKGIKAGFFRPITLFPFPSKRLAELSEKVKKFITVEVNMGQMVNDVRLAVNGTCPVELINKGVGAPPSADEIVSRIEVL